MFIIVLYYTIYQNIATQNRAIRLPTSTTLQSITLCPNNTLIH